MLASVYSYRVMVTCCVRGRGVISNPVTFVNCCFLQSKWTPLHVAAKNGHLAVVEALVKSGAVLGIDMVVSMYIATCELMSLL